MKYLNYFKPSYSCVDSRNSLRTAAQSPTHDAIKIFLSVHLAYKWTSTVALFINEVKIEKHIA